MASIRDLFVTSIWGDLSALESICSHVNPLMRLHLLGNYFDNGADPVGVLKKLTCIQHKYPDNIRLYRYWHEDALLRLTGHVGDTDSYRRIWISPYLGTPFTLHQFGMEPWRAYRETGTQASPVHSEVTDFVLSKTYDWSMLPIGPEHHHCLKSKMGPNMKATILAFEGESLQVISTTPCDSDFFDQTLCPWIENQLNPFPSSNSVLQSP